MISLSPLVAVIFLFATDTILARWNYSHPHITYAATACIFIAPLFFFAIAARLSGYPNQHLEVEAIVTYLLTTLTYISLFSTTHIQPTLRIIYGVVIVHLVLTPPEETLLHRLLFVSSLCLHAQHMASILIEWSGNFERGARGVQQVVTYTSFLAITLAVAVDIWAGQPMWVHFALLAAIPHAIPLDLSLQRGECVVPPVAYGLITYPAGRVLITNEGKPCDETGFLVNY